MEEKKSIPVSLTVVAILFILSGIQCGNEIIVSIMNNHPNLVLEILVYCIWGILTIFMGSGLLRTRRGWRKCALIFNLIAVIGLPILALLIIIGCGPLNITIFGHVVAHPTRGLGLLIVGIEFPVVLWVHHVLTRPDVKELFQIQTG